MELPQIHEDSKYIDNLLEMLELTEKSNVLPSKLSGGQQQRVAIARAMVNKPAVLIENEPTGNLDSESEIVVMELFKKCIKEFDTTMVMVTHNLHLIHFMDRVITINDGVVHISTSLIGMYALVDMVL